MKEENEWDNFLECFLASCRLDVDINTLIYKSLVYILFLYWKTGNLGSETNLPRPNPLARAVTPF